MAIYNDFDSVRRAEEERRRREAMLSGMNTGAPDAPEMPIEMINAVGLDPNAAAKGMAEETVTIEGAIGEKEIRKAAQDLADYKAAKAKLDARVKENEDWWRLRHWQHFHDKEKTVSASLHAVKPTSAWLFNSIINKHADMMDNVPEPTFLPREEGDEATAKILNSVVPVILERAGFEETYSENGWGKLKKGTGIYGVFWDNSLDNGLGDVSVRELDILSVFWEPGIKDIQDSKDLFIVDYWDIDTLEAVYPELNGKIKGTAFKPEEYDTEIQDVKKNKVMVVDWYYKTHTEGKTAVHFVKFVNDYVIYASENDPQYAGHGYYDHGMYPVVFDPMFPEEGSPAGFGYIDIMRSPQEYIDRLDASILKNAIWGAKPRYFVSDSANVNDDEFADSENDLVSVAGSIDPSKISPIQVPGLNGVYVDVRTAKIEELKETSGNRDFSQGATSSGVTSGSAIAALQEAGSKTARDLNKASYRAFTSVCTMVLELVRQFYTEQRSFRIIGENMMAQYVQFDNSGLTAPQAGMEYGQLIQGKLPVFDIKVKAQKSSPFSRLSQNELALQLYGAGVFNPELSDQADALIEMMDFEGKDKVRERIQQNGTLFKQVQQLQAIVQQMAPLLTQVTGDPRVERALMQQGMMGAMGAQGMPAVGDTSVPDSSPTGYSSDDNSQAAKSARAAAERGSVR